jgi:hypothetical protein
MPSLEKIILPSRAMLRSWREQTLPARAAALEMSVELIDRLDADEDPGVHDMALLGVISDAMQQGIGVLRAGDDILGSHPNQFLAGREPMG